MVGVMLTFCPSGIEDGGEVVCVMVIRPPILVVVEVTVESDADKQQKQTKVLLCFVNVYYDHQ